MKDISHITLPNGVEIILAPRPGNPATTAMVTITVGSKYETKSHNGISHFLEHLMFKGTEQRPRSFDITSALDGLGAEYNAFTSHEETAYYAKARNAAFDGVADIVSDLYLHPIFKPEEIERERGVIIEEINMYEDFPIRRVQDLFMRCMYGDQPAGWDIAGEKEVVQKLGRDDFLSYRSEHYVAGNTIVTVAGGYPTHAEKTITELFASLPRVSHTPLPPTKDQQASPQELVQFKQSEQTHLVLGFRAFGASDPRQYTLWLLADILGGTMSSRLFQRIREELGAAYYVGAASEQLTDHGYIELRAGVDTSRTHEVITALLEECVKLKDVPVSEAELERSKQHYAGALLLGLETSDDLAHFYASQRVVGKDIRSPQEVISRIQAVTAEEIQHLANELFCNEGLNLAVLGPFKDVSFADILTV